MLVNEFCKVSLRVKIAVAANPIAEVAPDKTPTFIALKSGRAMINTPKKPTTAKKIFFPVSFSPSSNDAIIITHNGEVNSNANN